MADSFELAGHRVTRLQEGKVRASDLPVAVEGHDLLLWTTTYSLAETGGTREERATAMERVRDARVPSVSFHLDRWFGLARQHQVAEEPFFLTDLVLTADGGHDAEFAALGINHRWSPPGVFAPECRPVAPNRRLFPHDVVFVGSHPYPHPEWEPYRSAVIAALSARYGRRFTVWPKRGAIRGRRLQTLYASARVAVGDSCLAPRVNGSPMRMYCSDRVPESAGRGCALVHPHVEGVTDGMYRPGVDLLSYPLGDLDAMLAAVDSLLADDDLRRAIAASGRERVLGGHTYTHRAEMIASLVPELACR